MSEHYDVVVIGSGPAGRAAALPLIKAGKSVAIVEDYGFGGTCPLRGCEPKKFLVDAAFALARVKDMTGLGLTGEVKIDWAERMRLNRAQLEPASDRIESWLNMQGLDTYFGPARFTGPRSVEVDGETLEGDYVVIATGAKPRPLKFAGCEHVALSEDFLKMASLPESIIFVGGGFISFELGQLAARAGVKVTILEMFAKPLAPFDPDLVDMLLSATRELGIEVRTETPVNAVEKSGNGFIVKAGEGGRETFQAAMVFHGAGRVPALRRLDPDKAGVKISSRGTTVNEYMQSVSNPAVYAAGDAADTPYPLTPTATMEGEAVAHNILHGNDRTVSHDGVPSAVYTYPVLAGVGLLEEQAQKQGLKFKKVFKDASEWSEHQRIGLKHAGFKILIDEAEDRFLGAHMLGERAEEIVNIFGLAMQQGISVSRIKQTLWSYPSFIYNIRYVLP